MIRNKKFKKIGLIFGLKREMKLILKHKKDNFCVYGYGKHSKAAVNKLLNHRVDIVINLGFAGSIKQDLKNGDIVFINNIFNEKKERLSTFKLDKNLLNDLEKKIKFVKCDVLTVTKIVTGTKEKLNLVKKFKSVSVIDMEAFYIKKELLKANIPMISLKVIFDDLSFDIPYYIRDCIKDNGDLRVGSFIFKLIKSPLRIFRLLDLNIKFSKSKRILKSLIEYIQS